MGEGEGEGEEGERRRRKRRGRGEGEEEGAFTTFPILAYEKLTASPSPPPTAQSRASSLALQVKMERVPQLSAHVANVLMD